MLFKVLQPYACAAVVAAFVVSASARPVGAPGGRKGRNKK